MPQIVWDPMVGVHKHNIQSNFPDNSLHTTQFCMNSSYTTIWRYCSIPAPYEIEVNIESTKYAQFYISKLLCTLLYMINYLCISHRHSATKFPVLNYYSYWSHWEAESEYLTILIWLFKQHLWSDKMKALIMPKYGLYTYNRGLYKEFPPLVTGKCEEVGNRKKGGDVWNMWSRFSASHWFYGHISRLYTDVKIQIGH